MQTEPIENKTAWQGFYLITIVGGLLMLYSSTSYYQLTFINIWIPVAIAISSGIVAFFLLRKNCQKIYPQYGIVFPALVGLLSWGCIVWFIFIVSNYYTATPQSNEYHIKIKTKGWYSGTQRHAHYDELYILFDFNGTEKELKLGYFKGTDLARNVMSADSIALKIKDGGLGFKIISDYTFF